MIHIKDVFKIPVYISDLQTANIEVTEIPHCQGILYGLENKLHKFK